MEDYRRSAQNTVHANSISDDSTRGLKQQMGLVDAGIGRNGERVSDSLDGLLINVASKKSIYLLRRLSLLRGNSISHVVSAPECTAVKVGDILT
jgi:hypothetical protein